MNSIVYVSFQILRRKSNVLLHLVARDFVVITKRTISNLVMQLQLLKFKQVHHPSLSSIDSRPDAMFATAMFKCNL